MARVFITGSADGLGRAAAETLLADGHEVVVHARNTNRAQPARLTVGGCAVAVGALTQQLDEVRERLQEPNNRNRVLKGRILGERCRAGQELA
jgi:NAD(P)-dependent dehydrogenase (short-subunit alcohol dehydrogenase family)